MLESGRCEIDDMQWMERASVMGADQALLSILKDHGAPVSGLVYLEPDTKNYVWNRSGRDPFITVFSWRLYAEEDGPAEQERIK